MRTAALRSWAMRYRVMAYITGVAIIILCFAGVPLQYIGHKPELANVLGVVHGLLYIVYLICAWRLARMLKLTARPTVLMLLAGLVPVMTFVIERWITRCYIDPALSDTIAEKSITVSP